MIWIALDFILLATTYLAHKDIVLPLSYVIGSLPMTVANGVRGKWAWTWKETLSITVTIVATFVWLTNGAEWGVYAGVVALCAGGFPVFHDMIGKPDRESFPIWATTAFACICSLIGSDGTYTGMVLATGSLIFNGSLSVIVLRKPSSNEKAFQ